MITNPLRIYLPYCLEKLESGRFIPLNRDYKPVGSPTKDWSCYEAHPITLEIERLTPEIAASMSVTGDPDCSRIYLYNDGSAPWLGHKELRAYERRLARLLELVAFRSVAHDGAWTGCQYGREPWTSRPLSRYQPDIRSAPEWHAQISVGQTVYGGRFLLLNIVG